MFSRERFALTSLPSSSVSRVIRRPDRFKVDCQWHQCQSTRLSDILGRHWRPNGTPTTHLEGELLEGVGEARERLVAGTGLCNQRQRRRRTLDFPIGKLDARSLSSLVLEAWSGRGESPTAVGTDSTALRPERTRRSTAEGRPRQHHRMRDAETGTGEGEIGRSWEQLSDPGEAEGGGAAVDVSWRTF